MKDLDDHKYWNQTLLNFGFPTIENTNSEKPCNSE